MKPIEEKKPEEALIDQFADRLVGLLIRQIEETEGMSHLSHFEKPDLDPSTSIEVGKRC